MEHSDEYWQESEFYTQAEEELPELKEDMADIEAFYNSPLIAEIASSHQVVFQSTLPSEQQPDSPSNWENYSCHFNYENGINQQQMDYTIQRNHQSVQPLGPIVPDVVIKPEPEEDRYSLSPCMQNIHDPDIAERKPRMPKQASMKVLNSSDRKERRREQNRRAARKCRIKKKNETEGIINEKTTLEEKVKQLQQQVKELEKDKSKLKHILEDHMKTCSSRQSYFR